MKKITFFLSGILFCTLLLARGPQGGISHQAVIRNSLNEVVANSTVGIRVSILQGSASGTVVYRETHTPLSNANGLITYIIGQGAVETGEFDTIDWANEPYFLMTEADPEGGTSYTITGTTRLLSVPYALYAKKAGTLTGEITETDPVFTIWDRSTGISIEASQITDFQTNVSNNSDVLANTAKKSYPNADSSKLAGIEAGAEVNVNADWDATGGDAQILNKPTGTSHGDMLYWNDTAWVNVPVGQPGQFLRLTASNTPAWSGAAYPTVTTTAASSITSNSAESGGNVTSDGGAMVTVRGVCWSLLPNPTIADSITSDGTGTGSFISYLAELTPDTTYYVRAYATNSVGTGYGDEISFQSATIPVNDIDNDGITDSEDNCPTDYNPNQSDIDQNGMGDVCDPDMDGDLYSNGNDNCPSDYNPDQTDLDQDGIGDVCDTDMDGDGVLNETDNCPIFYNPVQLDIDSDGIGDPCDTDMDGDGILNDNDNCPKEYNPDQSDTDADDIGDVCDTDRDGDGYSNDSDNCPDNYNPDQLDTDTDGIGDLCDPDRDGDGLLNESDNCPDNYNPDQTDTDQDGIGDVCDNDTDGDGIIDTEDNCPDNFNSDQLDTDQDGIGDVCDTDRDGDGILNDNDICPDNYDPSQWDTDGDGLGDACDSDIDGDGIPNVSDNCPSTPNIDQSDIDLDAIGDVCDDDMDDDGILNEDDNCPTISNPNQLDGDDDGVGDACDTD